MQLINSIDIVQRDQSNRNNIDTAELCIFLIGTIKVNQNFLFFWVFAYLQYCWICIIWSKKPNSSSFLNQMLSVLKVSVAASYLMLNQWEFFCLKKETVMWHKIPNIRPIAMCSYGRHEPFPEKKLNTTSVQMSWRRFSNIISKYCYSVA